MHLLLSSAAKSNPAARAQQDRSRLGDGPDRQEAMNVWEGATSCVIMADRPVVCGVGDRTPRDVMFASTRPSHVPITCTLH